MRQLHAAEQHSGRGHPKITDAQVQQYLGRFDAGEKLKDLAEEAGVSAPSLSTRIKKLRGQAQETQPEPTREPTVVERLRDRVDELEDENRTLRQALQPKTHGPRQAPRRDQILEALEDGKLLTYLEIATVIKTTPGRVRSAVGKMSAEIEKFKGEGGKAYVRARRRQE